MPNSVREQIMADVVTEIETVTTGNGYDNTIVSVQRYMQSGMSIHDVPCCIVNFENERKEQGPSNRVTCELFLSIDIFAIHDEAQVTGSTAQLLNSLSADVEKALMADPQRGGLCRTSVIEGIRPFRLAEGNPISAVMLQYHATYCHDLSDPYVIRN